VIENACRQLAAWQRQFELPDLSIAINVSPQQLKHPRIVDVVNTALSNSPCRSGFEAATARHDPPANQSRLESRSYSRNVPASNSAL
jgi:hypothetical protein